MRQLPVILGVAGAAAVATLLTVGFSWAFAQKWGRPKRRVSTHTPSDHGLQFVPVSFVSRDSELAGWFIPLENSQAPTVVVPHGWGSNRAAMLPVAALLRHHGFAVLLYDSRGHGTSAGGPVTVLTFAEDLHAAIDYVTQRRDVDPDRVGVVGHSMGGAAALVAASNDPRIRAVVSSSAFAHPLTLTRRTLRCLHIPQWPFLGLVRFFVEFYLGTTMTEVAPQNRISHVTAPVLLLHGADDDLVPATDMEAIYHAANHSSTERVLLPGLTHRDVLNDPEYRQHIVDFLNQALGGHRATSATGGFASNPTA